MKNLTSSAARLVVIAFFALFTLSLVAFAGFGPCEKVITGAATNTIYCKHGVCFGDATVILDQYACQGRTEDPCTDSSATWAIHHSPKAVYDYGVHIPFTCVGVRCIRDIASAEATPGGSDCR